MLRKIILSLVPVFTTLFVIDAFNNEALTNTPGAPSGKTGSPGDGGATCTGCHAGTATTQAGLITSDIPATGYWPGTTYTITASVSSATSTKFGFEISPQNPAGAKLGTLIITNATETQLVGSAKYITHKTAGTSAPSGTKTWIFNWTAPAIGTGPVTFYGAFNASNSNSLTSGDLIIKSTLTVQEDLAAGIASTESDAAVLKIFPNPSAGEIFIAFEAGEGDAQISVYDLAGKTVYENIISGMPAGENTVSMQPAGLSQGIYFVSVNAGEKIFTGKIIRQ